MKLMDYEFGFADATKEYIRKPEIFENAFCDTRNIVEKLIDGYEFLLIGRKGVGKSAYSSKIQSIAKLSNTELIAKLMNLNDFEFSTFAKTGIDNDVSGTQKYKSSWDFILLFAIYKVLFNDLQMTESSAINDVVFMLDQAGFSLDNEYKTDIVRLTKIKMGVGVVNFDAEFEKKYNSSPSNYLERISVITEKMLYGISDAYLNERKVVIIIDGLDDVLRYKKNKAEIISSLIRSVDFLNDKCAQFHKKIKIVLLIREDIIAMLNDPDLNKIIQDGAIILNWSNRLEELKKIVDLRFQLSGMSESNALKCWDKIFPPKIRGKSTWLHVLDHTLYKPRDILQFLKYCQMEYPNNETLSLSDTQNSLKVYSNKYFIEEMKNELSGFIDEELIYLIPTVFRRLGGRAFDLKEIVRLFDEQCNKCVTEDSIKTLLLYLFDAGYIGQLVSNGNKNGTKRSVIFKYRNPTARIDYYQKFITHQGLHSGLGVRL
ncbi:P-loop ATPase, Sll1717 family [Lacrimispora celerecrescens]|uniref:Uncharacterized protein n=1 Tax=[Clostridium] celerecrescens 18A TaxID=1286362 RepID=A0A2M8Z2X9_9FIRM|nr:hypothetical protein [Lacrimispora celerecrescens]PJJ27804.1 hypothetical protein H171_1283 [[Clostridium] celerecrescens 18A]